MPIYYVEGYERSSRMCYVEADSPINAIDKAWNGEVIEGTQDTEPGENIQKGKWRASEAEEVHWDGKGFGRHLSYRTKT